jgi:hypothetical protein
MELIDGHVYRHRDTGYVFQATSPEGAPFVWALFRLNIYNRHLVYPIVAGSLIGYLRDEHGLWRALRVGDPKYTDQDKVLSPHPYLDEDILPNLECIASGINEYLRTL